ncbi:chromosome segregation protein SMC, partial [Jeotgalibaca porci]|uniref:chromosome segregation protein SMC n=1 Tax=Jeotgalibaca porci TaxID=1868793 RepID=UPI00359F654A
SSLTVLDPQGNKGGQQLLNSFVEELAIDLPKFMESTSKEKANTLLQIIGIGEELIKLDMEEQAIYNERYQVGREADRKKKFAEEQIHYPDAPSDLVSTMELIQQQQMILAINGENQRKRENAQRLQTQFDYEAQEIERVKNQLQEMIAKHEVTQNDLSIAKTSAQDLQDQSTAELEHSLQNVEKINLKVRANLDKEKAEQDAENYLNQYKELDEAIKAIREQRMKLLDNAELPLPGLSVNEGELTYNGQGWTDMSGSDQLKVSTAIVRKLKPECGFVLLDKLEQMDMITLNEFSKWLEQEGLQAIATRVSTGEECQIIIEDGYVTENKLENSVVEPVLTETKTWMKGAF